MSAVFVSPVELIMIQQQRFGGNIFQVTVSIVKKYGLGGSGLMRAVLPTILRDSVYVAGMLGVTPLVQDLLTKHNNLSENQAGFYASLIGGCVAALPSHPLDIIKTCMQGDMDQSKYKVHPLDLNQYVQLTHSLTQSLTHSLTHSLTQGFIAACRQTWSEGGINRIFNGCFWRSFNITATIVIANWCTNNFPRWMYPEKFKDEGSR